MLRTTCPFAAAAALLTLALPAFAWFPEPIGNGGFGPGPYPPSYYGWPLNDFSATFYGGMDYREYYAYGRGVGVASFPSCLPGPIYPYGYRPQCAGPHIHYVVPGPEVPLDPTAALIDVHLPGEAVVWLEGNATKQTGPSRQYQSPPLKAGQDYHYEIKARWQQDGRAVEETRELTVHAGEHLNVAFPSAAPPTQKVSAPNLLPEQVQH